jgi:3-oxoadipate enol-lactonase
MPYANVRDVSLYHERAGDGPPLLFISGSGGDLRARPNVMDGPLPKEFDVLAFDQRGLGRSSKPEHPYTMADYADDAAALARGLGRTKTHVVGVSFGGMVALELAIRHPDLVDRLVLACTSPGGGGGSSYPFHEIGHLAPIERARHLVPIADTRRDAAWAAANPEAYGKLVELGSTDPFADEPGRRDGYARQLAARADHDTFDRLPLITSPTLIAAGRFDGIARPQAQHAMAAAIPGARLTFFDGGHLFMIQDRTAIPAMVSFLKA